MRATQSRIQVGLQSYCNVFVQTFGFIKGSKRLDDVTFGFMAMIPGFLDVCFGFLLCVYIKLPYIVDEIK